MVMAHIKTEKEYAAIMARIDQLFFETNEDTPSDDPRLIELDMLSALVEEYEKEVCPIKAPTLAEMIIFRMHQWFVFVSFNFELLMQKILWKVGHENGSENIFGWRSSF